MTARRALLPCRSAGLLAAVALLACGVKGPPRPPRTSGDAARQPSAPTPAPTPGVPAGIPPSPTAPGTPAPTPTPDPAAPAPIAPAQKSAP